VAGCVEITQKGDLHAVMDDFSADVQDEGDQRQVGGVPVLDLAGPTGSAEPGSVEAADSGDPLRVNAVELCEGLSGGARVAEVFAADCLSTELACNAGTEHADDQVRHAAGVLCSELG